MADEYYLDFIWDKNKNLGNKIKHGLDFKTASLVFKDPLLYIQYDELHSENEYRNLYIGRIGSSFIATLVATDSLGLIRIISARKATKQEVKIYEKNAKTIQGY